MQKNGLQVASFISTSPFACDGYESLLPCGFQQLVQKESLSFSLYFIRQLPAACYPVFFLYYLKEYSVKETAELLNQPEATVRNRLRWGLHLLKTQFAKKPKNPV